MSEEKYIFVDKNTKVMDIIEIIESHYEPAQKIGNRYVVVDCHDGYDVWIINEHGEYEGVCGEDYKIVGSVDNERQKLHDALIERDRKLFSERKKKKQRATVSDKAVDNISEAFEKKTDEAIRLIGRSAGF